MKICNAVKENIPTLLQMWQDNFNDSYEFANFAISICDISKVFIVKDNETIVSMLISGIDVTAYGQKGFYLYGVCTKPEYRGKGIAKALITAVCDAKLANGYNFVITQPATTELFDFYQKLGFTQKTYLRIFDIDIKRNLWASADFDTVTSSRFKALREKFKEDEIVHFDDKIYQKFTEYIYSDGGSTAENADAYCIYFTKGEKIIIRDIFAKSTANALQLIQAIRERTGLCIATIELSQNSTLFLGEGKLSEKCVIKGLDKEVYANLMFD